jgi:hypothetical protein
MFSPASTFGSLPKRAVAPGARAGDAFVAEQGRHSLAELLQVREFVRLVRRVAALGIVGHRVVVADPERE